MRTMKSKSEVRVLSEGKARRRRCRAQSRMTLVLVIAGELLGTPYGTLEA